MRSDLRYLRAFSKFRAKKVEADGYKFASKAEYALYCELKLNTKVAVQYQDKIYLTKARILYRPDFKLTSKASGDVVWVEMKGAETSTWRIKRRLWEVYGPGRLLVYKMRGSKPYLFEEINPFASCDE